MAGRASGLVLDTTVLSNFLLIGQSQFLQRLPFHLLTVPSVVAEIHDGIASGKVPGAELDWLKVLELNEAERQAFLRYSVFLGAGEAAALAVCAARQLRLATDDFEARQIAMQLEIPLTGTVGLLMAGVRTKLIAQVEAEQWLQRMIQFGYRSPIKSLSELGDF